MEGFCKTHMPLSDNFTLKSKLLIKYFSAASFISYSLISTDFLQTSSFHSLTWTLWMRLTENKLMFTVLIFSGLYLQSSNSVMKTVQLVSWFNCWWSTPIWHGSVTSCQSRKNKYIMISLISYVIANFVSSRLDCENRHNFAYCFNLQYCKM